MYGPVPTEFFDRIIEERLKIPARLWPAMIDCLLAYDDTRELGRIRTPTQLLWGDHDGLFSRTQQDPFLAALPAARLKVYQETGHCPNSERPEWVTADIADFVAAAARGQPRRDRGPRTAFDLKCQTRANIQMEPRQLCRTIVSLCHAAHLARQASYNGTTS